MWPFKKKKKILSRERFLSSRPLRNPAIGWERSDDGTITLKIPRAKGGIVDLFAKSLTLPDYKQVKLDEVGSEVWQRLDGEMEVSQLIRWMNEQFKMNPREAEVSLGIYLEKLSERGYIVMLVPPPKPGTPEAVEEAKEMRGRLKDLEKQFKARKIGEEQYFKIKEEIERRLKMIEE